ncbi:hypothetical protein H0H81_000789 [Sphagnurus paluster]|uniref:Uncharacterized protein n=1 Tax=Sphagnurus paluster TaxID=117069 RepID=A0A9P7GHE7_9AGAR|nr:hypothetical protein H0H81_000789 [Sphagnurus paluster]
MRFKLQQQLPSTICPSPLPLIFVCGTITRYFADLVNIFSAVDNKDSPLPSKEIPGGSRVGVGSLPGNLSEVSVAKLPEERIMEGSIPAPPRKPAHTAGLHLAGSHYTMPSTEVPSGSFGGIGSLPGNYSEVSVAKLPDERLQECLPSHETDHEVLGKTGGVGALPGGPDESRVALLPEERVHPEGLAFFSAPVQSTQLTAKLYIAEIYGSARGAAAPPDTKSERKGSKLKEEVKEIKEKVSSSSPFKNDASAIGGGGTEGYHPALLHPPPENKKPDTLTEAVTTSSETSAGIKGDRRASTGSSGESHKIGFLEKMRAEAKVLTGKFSHKEKKSEEGKHVTGK